MISSHQTFPWMFHYSLHLSPKLKKSFASGNSGVILAGGKKRRRETAQYFSQTEKDGVSNFQGIHCTERLGYWGGTMRDSVPSRATATTPCTSGKSTLVAPSDGLRSRKCPHSPFLLALLAALVQTQEWLLTSEKLHRPSPVSI